MTSAAPAEAPPQHGTWLEIHAGRLRQNLDALRREFAPARLCFVVKADGYGHGVSAVVPVAEASDVRDFAVFSAHEAWHALDASDGKSRIQVMGHIEPENMKWVARRKLEPWVNDETEWAAVRNAGQEILASTDHACLPIRVHVEVETGMFRTGLDPDAAVGVVCSAMDHEDVEVAGLCTHLAGAEDNRNTARIMDQLEVFQDVRQRIEDAGVTVPLCHVSSSSAALVDPSYRMDMVRTGISGYGLWPTPEVKQRYRPRDPERPLRLHRALSWKTRVMATKHVPEGSFIGYGQSYATPRDTTIAILPVGYSDGFTRGLGNAGHVLLHGRRCPIVGPVNMNMVQVDVGHVPEACPGDEVVLIGQQGDVELGVHSFAEAQEVINYELMARISRDIPRHLVDPEGEDMTYVRGLDQEMEDSGLAK